MTKPLKKKNASLTVHVMANHVLENMIEQLISLPSIEDRMDLCQQVLKKVDNVKNALVLDPLMDLSKGVKA